MKLTRILESQSDGLEDLHLIREWATDGLEGADLARAKVMDEAIGILNATCCYPVSSLLLTFLITHMLLYSTECVRVSSCY